MNKKFEFNNGNAVYDIGGRRGVIVIRRHYDHSTGGHAIDYYVEFEEGGRWVDQGALFKDRLLDSLL